jgi:hypothetical protein
LDDLRALGVARGQIQYTDTTNLEWLFEEFWKSEFDPLERASI